jgi:hypothetical protein
VKMRIGIGPLDVTWVALYRALCAPRPHSKVSDPYTMSSLTRSLTRLVCFFLYHFFIRQSRCNATSRAYPSLEAPFYIYSGHRYVHCSEQFHYAELKAVYHPLNEPQANANCLAICPSWFLARLILDLEDGDTLLRNVSLHTRYTTLSYKMAKLKFE